MCDGKVLELWWKDLMCLITRFSKTSHTQTLFGCLIFCWPIYSREMALRCLQRAVICTLIQWWVVILTMFKDSKKKVRLCEPKVRPSDCHYCFLLLDSCRRGPNRDLCIRLFDTFFVGDSRDFCSHTTFDWKTKSTNKQVMSIIFTENRCPTDLRSWQNKKLSFV